VSDEESKVRKKHSNPGPDTNDPFKILGVDRTVDLSNPLVKEYKSKASKKARLGNE